MVSQVASSIIPSRDPWAPGFLARACLEAQKSPVKGPPGPEGVHGSSLVRPTAAMRPSFCLGTSQTIRLDRGWRGTLARSVVVVAGRRVGGVSINLVTHPLGENEMGVLIVVWLIFVLNNVSGVVSHCD